MVKTAPDQSEAYFDDRINAMTVYVLPGSHFVQSHGENAICTLLGSCVAACIRDRSTNIGGLNHFLLPDGGSSGSENSERYGVYAMEVLINGILKRGAQKSNLEAKIFGGARVIETSQAETVGEKNAKFVLDYLSAERIPILAQDLGGDHARRVYFFPNSGRVSVLNTSSKESADMKTTDAEIRAQAKVRTLQNSGGVELF